MRHRGSKKRAISSLQSSRVITLTVKSQSCQLVLRGLLPPFPASCGNYGPLWSTQFATLDCSNCSSLISTLFLLPLLQRETKRILDGIHSKSWLRASLILLFRPFFATTVWWGTWMTSCHHGRAAMLAQRLERERQAGKNLWKKRWSIDQFRPPSWFARDWLKIRVDTLASGRGTRVGKGLAERRVRQVASLRRRRRRPRRRTWRSLRSLTFSAAFSEIIFSARAKVGMSDDPDSWISCWASKLCQFPSLFSHLGC